MVGADGVSAFVGGCSSVGAAELTGGAKATEAGVGVATRSSCGCWFARCPCTFCAEVGGGDVRDGAGNTVRALHSFSKALCVRK